MNQPQMNPMYMNPMLINPIGMNPMGINPMEINNQKNNFNQIGMDQTAIEVKNIVQPYEIKIKELEEIIRQKDLEIAILKQKLNKSSSNNNFININPMIMGQNMNPMMMQGFSLQNPQFLKEKAKKLHILLKTENGDFSNECSRQDKVSILYEKNNINRGYLIHKYKVLLPDFTFRENGINKNYSLIYLKNDCIDIIFKDTYSPRVGFGFQTFNIRIKDKIIKLQTFDTCGKEMYRSLVTNFYRSASLTIIVYAINKSNNFNNIDLWIKDCKTNSSHNAKLFLIGNKIDIDEKE